MSQTIVILLHFHEKDTEAFENLFQANILPMWAEFKAAGKFISASLSPVVDGSHMLEGMRDYILHVEVPSEKEHDEFDTQPAFQSFLEKVRPLQPEEPGVWIAETKYQVE